MTNAPYGIREHAIVPKGWHIADGKYYAIELFSLASDFKLLETWLIDRNKVSPKSVARNPHNKKRWWLHEQDFSMFVLTFGPGHGTDN